MKFFFREILFFVNFFFKEKFRMKIILIKGSFFEKNITKKFFFYIFYRKKFFFEKVY